MRVVAGKAKGIPLKAPAGDEVRPTVDRLKETLFNMIQYEVADMVVADVFAGSGGLGIEALSRGATEAYFCEKNKAAFNILKENIKKTGLSENANLFFGDYKLGLSAAKAKLIQFDLVFLDPPYHLENLYSEAIAFLAENDLLAEDALIIAETKKGFDFSFLEKYDTIKIEKLKIFKTNQYCFIRCGSGE